MTLSPSSIPDHSVSLQTVRRVEALANLQLTAEEEPRMQRDLNAILGHIAQLSELETSHVEPMAQVPDILAQTVFQDRESLRADEVRASVERKLVMASAPETDGRFFKVPRVIER